MIVTLSCQIEKITVTECTRWYLGKLAQNQLKIFHRLRNELHKLKCLQGVRDTKEASELYQWFLDAEQRVLHSTVGVKGSVKGISD